MHSLLDGYMPCEDARDVIIEYAQVGYRWYRFEFQTEDSQSSYWGHEYSNGMIFVVAYDEDDHFHDNNYYKKKKASAYELVSFAEWRKVLDGKYMKDMTDEDLAKFIGEVDRAMLSGWYAGGEMEKWLVDHHK